MTTGTRRLIILGPPAGGKGTLAERLAAELGIPHIATGDMLREEVAHDSELGRQAKALMDAGELVPDELVVAMTVARLQRPDCSPGWILDGFPRDLEQAEELEGALGSAGVDWVIALKVTNDVIIGRISGRRMCPHGHVYHLVNNPPKNSGICDVDGETLFQRDDDTEDVIRRRIEIYEHESKPVIDFYNSKGVLVSITASGDPTETYERVRSIL